MKYLLSLLMCFLLTSCFQTKSNQQLANEYNYGNNRISDSNANVPSVLVYKTKSDYLKFVPITLSSDKSRIISYPHPSDLEQSINDYLPSKLARGYLLDNKGISPNTAFLNITYEEYSKLEYVPSLDDLYKMIIDKNPILELCNCGNRYLYPNLVEQVNQIIVSDSLYVKCKSIK
jgi:hypothetical protein